MAVIYNSGQFLSMYFDPSAENTKRLEQKYAMILKENAKVESKIDAVNRAGKEYVPYIKAIDACASLRPENVFFNRVECAEKEKMITINGFSSNLSDINTYKEKLEQEKMFKTVNLEKINSNKQRDSNDIKSFTIRINI